MEKTQRAQRHSSEIALQKWDFIPSAKQSCGQKSLPSSLWGKDKGGQDREQAAVKGVGPLPAGPTSLFPESSRITDLESWKNLKSLSIRQTVSQNSTNRAPECAKAQKGKRVWHTQGPASDCLVLPKPEHRKLAVWRAGTLSWGNRDHWGLEAEKVTPLKEWSPGVRL